MSRGGGDVARRRANAHAAGLRVGGEGARNPAGLAGVEQACWMLGLSIVIDQWDGLCGAGYLSVASTVCRIDNL